MMAQIVLLSLILVALASAGIGFRFLFRKKTYHSSGNALTSDCDATKGFQCGCGETGCSLKNFG